MTNKTKELVAAGHALAKELHCAESAALVRELATQLDVQLSRGNALAAENAGLKAAFDKPQAYLSWHAIPPTWEDPLPCGEYLDVHDEAGHKNSDGTDCWPIFAKPEIETQATDAFLAEVKREATEPLQKEIEVLKKHLLMSVGDIRDLIDYNAETGVLTAKVNFSGRQAGSVIGSQTWQGYYAFSLFGKKCFAHRLAWLLHYGEWPSQPIDHINGIKTDNSIRNLRLCSLSQNQFNKPTQKNNTTGVKGVYWNKRDKRYVASVQFNGKKYSAGHHKDIESAKEEVMKLREKLAGEFTNHGEFELAEQIRKGVQS